MVEQDGNRVSLVLQDGEMQGGAALLEAAHAGGRDTRVLGDQPLQQVGAAQRDRGKHRRGRSLLQQIGRDLGANRIKAGRPADYAGLVGVAMALDVDPNGEQPLDDAEMAAARGPMQRSRIVEPVAQMRIEAAPQQHVDAG
jgi:hypothetical protein